MDEKEEVMENSANSNESDDEMDSDDGEEVIEEGEDGENMGEEEGKGNKPAQRKVYLPGQPLQSDERLVCDESAYIVLHQAKTGAPCLSFDIIPDDLGNERTSFPATAYLVAGTQGERANNNHVIVIKMSNVQETLKDESDESEDESDDEEEATSKLPRLDCNMLAHKGCINRIRASVVGPRVLASSWSELGHVHIWDLTPNLSKLSTLRPTDPIQLERTGVRDSPKPIYSFSGHQGEGFAMDWCRTIPGMLATGDCARNIHIWTPKEGGNGWIVDQRPLSGHKASVEDVQWSPTEKHVLASCSVDCSIRIWDTRAAPSKACKLTVLKAHEGDVNVISWNRNEPLLVSGGDDGKLNVWDLRQFESPVATFKHHSAPVTTVEWHPTEASVFASGGADDQIALWDLGVERDAPEAEEGLEHLPPQLLFIHQGQKDIKEMHWHPQIPGLILSTALTGFNIFKTISV